MKLAQFNADGLPLAFYDIEINAGAIPEDAVEITDDQWLELINHQGQRRFKDGEVVEYVPPAPTIDDIRATMPALSPRQFWLAASRINITKADVLALVDAMEDKQSAADMRIEVTETVSFQRTNPAVDQLATLLNIPPEQLDSLWTWAAQF
jgi:hypothetical protein